MADGGFDTTPFALRMTLIRNGYTPVPITDPDDTRPCDSPGKAPLLTGWQTLNAESLTESMVRGWRDPGTGILTRFARAVDIDVLDPDLSARLRMLTVDMLGPTPLIRVGRAPKTLFVYRSADQAAKVLTPKMMLPDGSEAQVELLGAGQQFVAFGIHPGTRQPYAWERDTPLTVPLADLPAVTQEQLIALRDAAEALMREAGAAPLKAQKKASTKARGKPRSPGLGLPEDEYPQPSVEEVADALRAVPNDFDWNGWVAMGASIFDALADDGEDLFIDWSRQHAKNDDDATRRKWASFKTSPSIMTRAYLFRCARDNGWKPEREKQRQNARPEAPMGDDAGFIELTEDGVAIRFAEQHGHEFRFCHDTGKWFVWTGTHWQMNRDRLAFQAARELVRALNRSSEFKTKAITGKVSFAGGVETFAQRDRVFAVTVEVWDKNNALLGTPGGTVDLVTGQLRPAKQEDFITRVTAVAPAETADCPTWLAFLKQATADDLALTRFLQQWCGYCLTGSTREHALLFIYGPGGNGKSVFLNTVAGILAAYCTTAPMDTFTSSTGDRHPTDLAMLRGARLVTATETEDGRAWAEAKIKQMTGGDPIAARFMRQDFFTFTPNFKLTIAGNHKPALRNVDEAAKRRFNIVPFLHKPAQPDRQLEAKLKKEWPGILRWMIEGCLDWQKAGLVRPAIVTEATEEYFEAQDVIGRWMAERCILAAHLVEKPGNLASDCREWAGKNGEAVPTPPQVRSALEKVQGVRFAKVKGDRQAQGIGLRPPENQQRGAWGA